MPRQWGDEEVVLGPWPSRCKKRDGSLSVTVNRLLHEPSDFGVAIVVDFREVQTRQISPRTNDKAKAVVKLVLKSGETIFVELTGTGNGGAERWAHQGTLARWMAAREAEVRSLEEEVRREAELLGDRMQVVLNCPELRERYTYLVKQKQALTHEEFFRDHASEIAILEPLPQAPEVTVAALQASRAMASRVGGPGVSVSDEEAKTIFRELPELEKLYRAVVPSMLNAVSFWERCFASRYYREAMGQHVAPTHPEDALFDALERPVASEGSSAGSSAKSNALAIAAVASGVVDVEADLTGEVVSDKDRVEATRPRRKGGLFDRLNERSAAALAAATAAPAGGGGGASSAGDAGGAAKEEALQHDGGGNDGGSGGAIRESEEGEEVEALRLRVEKRREALRRVSGTVREDLDGFQQPAPKIARLHGSGCSVGASVFGWAGGAEGALSDAAVSSSSGATPIGATALASTAVAPAACPSLSGAAAGAVSAWGSEASTSTRLAAVPSTAGAKWVVVEATQEMIQANKLAQRTSSGDAPEMAREVSDAMAHSKALLRHFWSSRWNEADMRGRLVREMRGLLQILDQWQKEPSVASGKAAGAASAALVAARRAARSLAPPLQRAAGLQEVIKK